MGCVDKMNPPWLKLTLAKKLQRRRMAGDGGLYWIRTSDPYSVKVML